MAKKKRRQVVQTIGGQKYLCTYEGNTLVSTQRMQSNKEANKRANARNNYSKNNNSNNKSNNKSNSSNKPKTAQPKKATTPKKTSTVPKGNAPKVQSSQEAKKRENARKNYAEQSNTKSNIKQPKNYTTSNKTVKYGNYAFKYDKDGNLSKITDTNKANQRTKAESDARESARQMDRYRKNKPEYELSYKVNYGKATNDEIKQYNKNLADREKKLSKDGLDQISKTLDVIRDNSHKLDGRYVSSAEYNKIRKSVDDFDKASDDFETYLDLYDRKREGAIADFYNTSKDAVKAYDKAFTENEYFTKQFKTRHEYYAVQEYNKDKYNNYAGWEQKRNDLLKEQRKLNSIPESQRNEDQKLRLWEIRDAIDIMDKMIVGDINLINSMTPEEKSKYEAILTQERDESERRKKAYQKGTSQHTSETKRLNTLNNLVNTFNARNAISSYGATYSSLSQSRKALEQKLSQAKTASERQQIMYEIKKINGMISNPEIMVNMTEEEIENERAWLENQINAHYQRGAQSYYNAQGKAISNTLEDEMVDEYEYLRSQLNNFNADASIIDEKKLTRGVMLADDFEEMSKVANPLTYSKDNYHQHLYNLVNYGDITTKDNQDVVFTKGDHNDLFKVAQAMNEDEKKAYNYIVNTKGLEAGTEYLMSIIQTLNREYTRGIELEEYQWAKENPWLAAGKELALTIPNELRSLVTSASDIGTSILGNEVDPYDLEHLYLNKSNARVMGGADAFENGWAQFGYETLGMTAKEALNYLATAGIGKAANLTSKGLAITNSLLHSGTAFESKMKQYIDEGYDNGSAIIAGITSAGIEAVTEALPFEEIFRTPDLLDTVDSKWITQAIKKSGFSALEEGGEEVASMILNDIYDIATNHENLTTFYQTYNKAIGSGESHEDALNKAFLATIGEAGQNALAGAVVGFGLSVGNTTINVKQADVARQDAEQFFGKYGSDVNATTAFLMDELGTEDVVTAFNLATQMTEYANGNEINEETKQMFNDNPILRGTVYALVNSKKSTMNKALDNVKPTPKAENLNNKPAEPTKTIEPVTMENKPAAAETPEAKPVVQYEPQAQPKAQEQPQSQPKSTPQSTQTQPKSAPKPKAEIPKMEAKADATKIKSVVSGNDGSRDTDIVNDVGNNSTARSIKADRPNISSSNPALGTVEKDKPLGVVYVPGVQGKTTYGAYYLQTEDSRGGQISSVNSVDGNVGFDAIYDMDFVDESSFTGRVTKGETLSNGKISHNEYNGSPEVVKQLLNMIFENATPSGVRGQITYTMDDIDVNNFNDVSIALFSEISQYLPQVVKNKLSFSSQMYGKVPRYIKFGGINGGSNVGRSVNIDQIENASGKYIEVINELMNMDEAQRDDILGKITTIPQTVDELYSIAEQQDDVSETEENPSESAETVTESSDSAKNVTESTENVSETTKNVSESEETSEETPHETEKAKEETKKETEKASQKEDSKSKKSEENIEETRNARITESLVKNLKEFLESDNKSKYMDSLGRSAMKLYSTYITKDSPFMRKLVRSGMRLKTAREIADGIFFFMYDAGARGVKLNVANAAMSKVYPGIKEYTTMFYYAGVNDKNTRIKNKVGAKIVENDVIKSMRESKLIDSQAEDAINAIANQLGLDIIFVDDMGKGKNGSFNAETGELKISKMSEIPFVQTVIHESVHAIRSVSPESYKQLQNVVFEVLSANKNVGGEAWKYIRDLYVAEATDENGNVNKDLIDEELVANVMSALMFNEDYVSELASSNPRLLKRLWNAIRDFFDRVFKRYKRTPFISIEMEDAMRLLHKHYGKIESLYKGALENVEMMQEGRSDVIVSSMDSLEMYSITSEDVKLIQSIGKNGNKRMSINSLTESQLKTLESVAKKYYREMGVKSPFFRRWFGDWRAEEKKRIKFVDVNSGVIDTKDIPNGKFKNDDTKWEIKSNSDGKGETANKRGKWSDDYHALKDIEAMLYNAVLLDTIIANNPSKRMGKSAILVHHLYCPIKINGKNEFGIAKLYVSEYYDGGKKFYLNKIEKMSSDTIGYVEKNNNAPESENSASNDITISVAEIFDFVKKNDVNYESDSEHPVYFKPKPTSLVLNDDGTPRVIYHGTQKFGFSKFDISKSDDKSTIFLADSPELASTYSGVTAVKSKKDVFAKDIKNMSLKELAAELTYAENQHFTEDTGHDKSIYTVYDFNKSNKLIQSVNSGIDNLKNMVDEKINELADKMATDWDYETHEQHRKLVSLKEAVYADVFFGKMDYSKLSTQLYMIIHHTDIFKNESDKLAELEKNIRIMGKLSNADISDGIIVREELGGYVVSLMNKFEAANELESIVKRGNYATYAKMTNPLIVDVKGRDWNDIREWSNALIPDVENLDISDEDGAYYLINKTNKMHIPGAVVPQTDATKNLPKPELISLMRDEAKNIWAIRTESKKKTRDVSDIAKQWGYDGVIFKNIKDNGGQSYNSALDEIIGDVYVVFEPNQLKSVDNGGTFSSWDDDIYMSKTADSKTRIKLKDVEADFDRFKVLNSTEHYEAFKQHVVQVLEEEIEKAKNPKPKKTVKPMTKDVIEGNTYIGDDGHKVVIVPEGTPGASKVYIAEDGTAIEQKPRDGEKAKGRFALTTLRSDVLNSEQTKNVMNLLRNDETFATYVKFTDNEALAEAEKTFEEKGYEKMLDEWGTVIDSGAFPTKQFMTNGLYLLKKAAEHNDGDATIYLLTELNAIATQGGQVIQSLSILTRRLGGEARAYAQIKALKRLEAQIRTEKGNEGVTLSFPQELVNEYIKAVNRELAEENETEIEVEPQNDNGEMMSKTPDVRSSEEILAEMWSAVSEDIPPSWANTLMIWRYASMLSNLSTHISNIAANSAHYVATIAKNFNAALLEKMFIAKEKRTKSIKGTLKSTLHLGENYKFAQKDAREMESTIRESDKYSTPIVSRAKFKWVQKASDAISGALRWEDWMFMRGHYARALANYMDARGYKPRTITKAQLDEGRKIAMDEARRATFNEANKLVEKINDIIKTHDALDFIFNTSFPFFKVPVNVLKTAIEYSPLGFLRTLSPLRYKSMKGDLYRRINNDGMSGAEYIDRISRNLTGTGVFLIGTFLFAKGILKINDDDKENTLIGGQKYSIEFGDYSYSLDWLAPAGIALMAGAEFWKTLTSEDDGFQFTDLLDVLPSMASSTVNMLFEMSMLENVAYTLNSLQYGDSWYEKGLNFTSSLIFNRIGQYIPNVIKAIAKTIDNTKRGIYVDKDSKIPQYIQVGVQQLIRNIPFILPPTVDAKGNPEKNSADNIVLRAIDNFILPGSLKKLKSVAVDDELLRLYKATEKSFLPGKLQKSFEVDGETRNLSAKEYAKYQTIFSQTYYQKVKDIVDSEYYKNLSDDFKAKLLVKVKEYATEKAKHELDSRFMTNGWLKVGMEVPGVYQYLLDLNPSDNFSEDDIPIDKVDSYVKDRESVFMDVYNHYNPSGQGYDFEDAYYDYLYTLAKVKTLDNYSNGQFNYSSTNQWVEDVKDWTPREQAEYIYGKTLKKMQPNSTADEKRATNTLIQDDTFISAKVKASLYSNTGFGSSPKNTYDKYLKGTNVSEEAWGNIWNEWSNAKTYKANGKTYQKKDQILPKINNLPISNEEKSRIYYAFDWGTSEKALKGVPWNFVKIDEFEEK